MKKLGENTELRFYIDRKNMMGELSVAMNYFMWGKRSLRNACNLLYTTLGTLLANCRIMEVGPWKADRI